MNIKIERNLGAILLAVCAFFCYSMADILQKYLGTVQGYSLVELLLWPTALSSVLSFLFIFIRRGRAGFYPKREGRLYLVWLIMALLGSYSIVNALQLIPLAQFYGIVFSIPFLVACGGVIFFAEHPGWMRWGAIICGFIGVWIATNPDFSNLNMGIAYAALAAVFLSASHLTMRKIGTGDYPPLFPFLLHGTLFLVNFIVLYVQGFEFPDLADIPLFIGCGIALFVAVISISTSTAITPLVSIIMPFQYSQILWGVIFGFLIFAEIPPIETWLGLALIIMSGLFMIWREYLARYRHPSL